MQSHEALTHQLSETLALLGKAMQAMADAMARNRAAFVAIDAGRLEAGLSDLEPFWQTIERLEQRRTGLAEQLRETLGADHELRISRLLEMLPAPLARQLRTAADAAEAAARRVRGETNAGARLLRVSRQVNEETVRSLTGASTEQHGAYDSHAKRVGDQTANGRLVIGTA